MKLLKYPIFLFALSAQVAIANSPVLNVEDIVDGIDSLPEPNTSSMTLKMELVDNRGNTRVREMRSYSKVLADKDMMAMYFDSPSNVRDTAYLSHDFEDDSVDDDSWLYLPAMRRTKRVSGRSEADAFMGSDFSYADINGIDIDHWDFSLVEESVLIDGVDCWVLDAVPSQARYKETVKETGYKKRRVWVRKDNFFVIRAELTQTKSKKVKYLKIEGLKEIDGFWIADTIRMITTKGGDVLHESRMHFTDIKLNVALNDDLFSEFQLGK